MRAFGLPVPPPAGAMIRKSHSAVRSIRHSRVDQTKLIELLRVYVECRSRVQHKRQILPMGWNARHAKLHVSTNNRTSMDGPNSCLFPLLLEGQTKRRPVGAPLSTSLFMQEREAGEGGNFPR